MYKLLIAIFCLILMSCASTKQAANDNKPNERLSEKSDAASGTEQKIDKANSSENSNVIMKARINISFPEIRNSAAAKIEIAKTDSILIQIFGPMSIPVGKLYANPTQYIMNSNLENITYKGMPTEENIKKSMSVPLAFNDLVYLLRNALPNNSEQYSFVNIMESNKLYVLSDKMGAEFALIDTNNRRLVRFQKKNANNEMVMDVAFSSFTEIGDYTFANKISINFPLQDGRVDIEFQEIAIVPACSSPMSFTQPKSYRLFQYD